MVGTAPRADVWVAVEHPSGWGEAPLARAGNGVRVVMARGPRTGGPEDAGAGGHPASGRVWVAYATGTPVLRVGTVDQPEEVAAWDLAAVAAGSLRDWGTVASDPLLLVCANGRRDRCCGHTGGRLADELWSGPHRDRVLTCTHLGGHRFAPTALLLPFGALHGRLDAPTAARLLADADAGRMRAVTLRGMSTLAEPAQVAEAHVRAATGYAGLAPLAGGRGAGRARPPARPGPTPSPCVRGCGRRRRAAASRAHGRDRGPALVGTASAPDDGRPRGHHHP